MKFSDIPARTDERYSSIRSIDAQDMGYEIDRLTERYGLELCPDFQRGHVWTERQQIAFVEFILQGGRSPSIRLNHPGWMGDWKGHMVCVDGLQRITAWMRFLNNEIKAFGHLFIEFDDRIPDNCQFHIIINNLKRKKDVLRWYLELNGGGTAHTEEELNRVRLMMEESQ